MGTEAAQQLRLSQAEETTDGAEQAPLQGNNIWALRRRRVRAQILDRKLGKHEDLQGPKGPNQQIRLFAQQKQARKCNFEKENVKHEQICRCRRHRTSKSASFPKENKIGKIKGLNVCLFGNLFSKKVVILREIKKIVR